LRGTRGVCCVCVRGNDYGCCSFYALHRALDPESDKLKLTNDNTCIEQPDPNEFLNFQDAIARTFMIGIMGDFDVDALRNPLDRRDTDNGTGLLTNISFAFFFVLVLLIPVVALNALIALMGSTFGRVEQTETIVMYKEMLANAYDKWQFRIFTGQIKLEAFRKDHRWLHRLANEPVIRDLDAENPTLMLRKQIESLDKNVTYKVDSVVEKVDKVSEVVLGDDADNGIITKKQFEQRMSEFDSKFSDITSVLELLKMQINQQETSFKELTNRLSDSGLSSAQPRQPRLDRARAEKTYVPLRLPISFPL